MNKDFKKRLQEIKRNIDKNIDPTKFDFLKKEVVEQIKKRTQAARKGVNADGSMFTLPKLSEPYVEFRKTFKKLSSETSPNRSNLTLTGSMLNDMVAERSGFTFKFSFKDELNSKKANWVALGGRRFFDLSKSERNGLQRKISDIIRQEIIKMFNS